MKELIENQLSKLKLKKTAQSKALISILQCFKQSNRILFIIKVQTQSQSDPNQKRLPISTVKVSDSQQTLPIPFFSVFYLTTCAVKRSSPSKPFRNEETITYVIDYSCFLYTFYTR